MSAEPAIRVILVEDQALFRSLLSDLVRAEPGFELVAAAAGIAEARALAADAEADVVLLDIELPDGNGFQFGRELRRARPGLGVVLLSSHDLMELLLALPDRERAGWSYLSKVSSTSRETLLRALRVSARGASMLDPELLGRLRPRRGSALAGLTPRQLHALRLLAEGLSNAAIARDMGISNHSVDNLLNAVYSTLGVRDDGDLNSRVAAALHLVRDGAPGGAGA
ncbi:response regulator [Agromyces mediolanus]|uniref:DNA-binding response regulator n=1 Tax=Agromyces mediolanus TaxID=41986 RepID=A0A918C8D5_AGRME|nr:response regulator transcription factor [Agromyces mediolanus]GGR11790.1 DNA-binding response regulator [Agromyces mediolanus]GLJ73275.1 DNA-binding response regulator [Agromyces mediolanus]